MTINCRDIDNFVAVIARLVEKGLQFTADADGLTITLTGGY